MAELKARDPLETFRQLTLRETWLGESECDAIEAQVKEVVEDAIHFAEESPPPTDLGKDVYVKPIDLYRGNG